MVQGSIGTHPPVFVSPKLPESAHGLGIVTPAPEAASHDSRSRAYTIDSFNISSVESYKPQRLSITHDTNTHNLEKATWTFTDILQSISVKEKDDLHSTLPKANQLVDLLIDNPALRGEILIQTVVSRIQFMLYDLKPQLRCAAYRILRYTCASQEALKHLIHLKILIFLIVSLSTQSPLLEKEEALKLIREFLNIPNGSDFLSIGIIKALVACVDHEFDEAPQAESDLQSDSLYGFIRMCIETISEIAVLKPDIAFHGGGLRLLIHSILNGNVEISFSCITTMLTLLDMPQARLFLRNGFDLDSLTSVFTLFEDDDEGKIPNTKKYYNKALKMSFLLSFFLKTWTGLICFSHDLFNPIKMIVSNLKKRNTKLCSIILDLILDLLHIKSFPWLEDSSIGDLLINIQAFINNGSNSANTYIPSFDYHPMKSQSFEYSIVSHYQGLLLKILINCELLPRLFEIVNQNKCEENTTKATFLLTNIFELCSALLPPEFYNDHVLVAYSSELSLSSLIKIEAATKIRQKEPGSDSYLEVKSIVKDMTLEHRMAIQDNVFKTLILNTKVLALKDFDDWDLTALSHLFSGPLRNRQRFAELQEKYPRFLRIVFLFLRPFKYRFSTLALNYSSKHPRLKKPQTVINVGAQLLESLLCHDEGAKLIASNKLMAQIAEIFAQVDPFSGISSKDPILSRKRLENTLSIGYVRFVGLFSGSARGLEILERWQFFQLIMNIIAGSLNSQDNNYLICNILNYLNYTLKSPTRLLLDQALNNSNSKIKVFILGNVLPRLSQVEECEGLFLRSLVTLLYDASSEVVDKSIEYLHDYFISKNNLEKIAKLVELRPSTSILARSKLGSDLLLEFCTTPLGFRYLEQNGFIEQKFMACVKQLQSFEYINAIEHSLKVHFYPYLANSSKSANDGGLQHFFKFLLATEDGFNYFNTRRYILDEVIAKIKQLCYRLNIIDSDTHNSDNGSIKPQDFSVFHSVDLEDLFAPVEPIISNYLNDSPFFFGEYKAQESPLYETLEGSISTNQVFPTSAQNGYLLRRLKQYLWVLGEVLSSKYGVQILEPMYSSTMSGEHIVDFLKRIFEDSSSWQIRGLAFYQFGKMAGTLEGIELLDELDWVSWIPGGPRKQSLAYPKFMQEDSFTKVEILNPYNDATYYSLFSMDDAIQVNNYLDLEDEVVIENYEEMDEKVLSLINYLSSVLGRIEKKARKELLRIKGENPEVFANPNLFLKTIRLVDRGKFKQKRRVFIFELFDTIKIMEELVKKNRHNSSTRRLGS